MSNPWDSWASNTDNWNAATYHWEDYSLSPASYAASLTGYAPDNPKKVASAIESVGGRAYIIGKDEGTKILSK